MSHIDMSEFESQFGPAEEATPNVAPEMDAFEADFHNREMGNRAGRDALRASLNELSPGEQSVFIGDIFQARILELYYQEYAKALCSYPPGSLNTASLEGQMLLHASMREGLEVGVQDFSPEINLLRDRRIRVLMTEIGTHAGSPWPLPEGNIVSGETAGLISGIAYSYDKDRSMKIADYFAPLLAIKYAKIVHAHETMSLTGEQEYFFIPLGQPGVKIRLVGPMLDETL